jgi:hypothetical protein
MTELTNILFRNGRSASEWSSIIGGYIKQQQEEFARQRECEPALPAIHVNDQGDQHGYGIRY